MRFKNYFNAYDTNGTLHSGFMQAMDFSALATDITFLNDLTMAIMDGYLYNELSESLVVRQWRSYMSYDRTDQRLEITPSFYNDFVNAISARLYTSEKWYQISKTNFSSLSATDIKTLEHGKKETTHGYGQDQTTNQYGQDQTSTQYGAVTNTRNYDKVVVTVERAQDTHVIGAGRSTEDVTTTGKLYPLGDNDFRNDTQSIVDGETNTDAQTNTDTWGDTGTETAAREDTESVGQHTDTETRNQRTDTKTRAQREDTEEIKAYTDTERHTRFIILSPDKYYAIQKELAELGVYELMRKAVEDTMLLMVWEGVCG